MTRQQSKLETIKVIRESTSGEDVTVAICNHFKKYGRDSSELEWVKVMDKSIENYLFR